MVLYNQKTSQLGDSETLPVSSRLLVEQAQKALNTGDYDRVHSLLSDFVDTIPGAELEHIEAHMLLGKSYRETGCLDLAKQHFEAALDKTTAPKLQDKRAALLNQLASIAAIKGELHTALKLLNQAEQLYNDAGKTTDRVDVLNNLGYLHLTLSQYDDALDVLQKGYSLLKGQPAPSRTSAINLQNLGLVYKALAQFERAQAFYHDAQLHSQHLKDPILEVVTLINMAEAYLAQALVLEAENSYEAALDVAKEHRLVRYEMNALLGVGNALYTRKLFLRAKKLHEQALFTAVEIKEKAGELDCLLALARDDLKIRNYPEATQYAEDALLIAEQTEQVKALADCHSVLASAYKSQGAFERAFFHLEACSNLKQDLFNEKNRDKTRYLSIKFDAEKARHEAELYKIKSQVEQKAHEQAKQLVIKRTAELEQAQVEIVTRLAVAAEYRDENTGDHTHRVGRTSALIAAKLGWPEEKLKLIYMAARLHDVGKIGISDTILLKPGRLTDEEFATIRTHTTIGGKILANAQSDLLSLAEEIALHHHERWDGQGYPARLASTDISQAARIVSVADVLDALTHTRPYKEAWTVDEALAEIKDNSSSQFDPAVVDVCLELFMPPSKLSPKEGAVSWESLQAELAGL